MNLSKIKDVYIPGIKSALTDLLTIGKNRFEEEQVVYKDKAELVRSLSESVSGNHLELDVEFSDNPEQDGEFIKQYGETCLMKVKSLILQNPKKVMLGINLSFMLMNIGLNVISGEVHNLADLVHAPFCSISHLEYTNSAFVQTYKGDQLVYESLVHTPHSEVRYDDYPEFVQGILNGAFLGVYGSTRKKFDALYKYLST